MYEALVSMGPVAPWHCGVCASGSLSVLLYFTCHASCGYWAIVGLNEYTYLTKLMNYTAVAVLI